MQETTFSGLVKRTSDHEEVSGFRSPNLQEDSSPSGRSQICEEKPFLSGEPSYGRRQPRASGCEWLAVQNFSGFRAQTLALRLVSSLKTWARYVRKPTRAVIMTKTSSMATATQQIQPRVSQSWSRKIWRQQSSFSPRVHSSSPSWESRVPDLAAEAGVLAAVPVHEVLCGSPQKAQRFAARSLGQ